MLGKLNHSRNSFYPSVKMLGFSIDHSSLKSLSSDLTRKSDEYRNPEAEGSYSLWSRSSNNNNYRCAQLQGSGQTPAPSLGHRFEPPRFRSRGQRPIIATSSSREGGGNFYVCPPHCVSTNVGCVGNVV